MMFEYRFLSGRVILFFVAVMMVSCSASKKVVEQETYLFTGFDHWNYSMADFIENDDVIAAIIEPYKSDIQDQLNTVLTRSTAIIERGQPEGPLGNLTADILRNRATREMNETVHIAILNNGGLRVPLPAGPVNIGHIFELMPFENHITILKLTGDQVITLADEIAAAGGEPVSGIRFRINNGKAEDVLVGNKSADPDANYWVATNNWLADGGGDMPTLWSPQERRDMQILIRDAFIEYLKFMPAIEPVTDSRIR
ncbi:MAG: 5'-nucleotidase C-terminal domain-containing protein [Rhodothermaceae bacterium]|nr:5'-nucleotidase C-terminal domain-containing protein [Rhodothermaceae bacterium]